MMVRMHAACAGTWPALLAAWLRGQPTSPCSIMHLCLPQPPRCVGRPALLHTGRAEQERGALLAPKPASPHARQFKLRQSCLHRACQRPPFPSATAAAAAAVSPLLASHQLPG